MIFTGAARPLDDVDLPRLGHRLGVGEDEIHAVMDAEARGSGFDGKKRPRMLYEPHIMWRLLGPGPARDRAAAEGLAYATWGERRYPKDSYPHLERALRIDADAALRSASWGRAQIMGFNAGAAGYASAAAMVAAFREDEETHIEAMVNFILANGLDDELRAHDWRGFARGYNGPGYERNGYHITLADSFAWWSKKPDTPWTPPKRPVKRPRPRPAPVRRADPADKLARLYAFVDAVRAEP